MIRFAYGWPQPGAFQEVDVRLRGKQPEGRGGLQQSPEPENIVSLPPGPWESS
jgi:hypothetical protein